MKNSTTWSSSRIATAVSRSVAETIISLVMPHAPGAIGHPDVFERARAPRRRVRRSRPEGQAEQSQHHLPHEEDGRGHHQFANRRIRTLRMQPKLMSVAIIDDPP